MQPVAGCSKYDYVAVENISQDSGEDPICSFNDFHVDKEKHMISKPQADHLKGQASMQDIVRGTPETQWSDESIMLLIATYKELQEKFNSPLYNKKRCGN